VDLRDALAVVTGAGSGLGRELAIGLSRRGAAVLVADRDLAAAEETAALATTASAPATAFRCDLAEEAEVRLLAARAEELGGADVLVNNAGGWTEGGAQYPLAPALAWSRTLDLDLRAPMLLSQLFLDGLDRMGRGRPGAVVNIASSAALGSEAYGSPEYAASKAGLVRFTTALGDPVTAARARVMAVVPGWIGLPRAHEEWAALSEEERDGLPPLIPPEDVVQAVIDLLEGGRPGAVVELG
jgi:NAD(P)-dependent dehydrogenase (short-subunit alcohol dehydrogenase family)